MNDELDPETIAEIRAALEAGLTAHSEMDTESQNDANVLALEAHIHEQDPNLNGDTHLVMVGHDTGAGIAFSIANSGRDVYDLLMSGRTVDAAKNALIHVVVTYGHATSMDDPDATRVPCRTVLVVTPISFHAIVRLATDPDTPVIERGLPEMSPLAVKMMALVALTRDMGDDE